MENRIGTRHGANLVIFIQDSNTSGFFVSQFMQIAVFIHALALFIDY